jgi:hypothetical protein
VTCISKSVFVGESLRTTGTLAQKIAVLMRVARVSGIVTGIVTLGCSTLGLYWSVSGYLILSNEAEMFQKFHYFYPIAYLMLAINIACFLVLGWCGVDQVRLRLVHTRLFIGLFIFELVYVLLIGRILIYHETIGESLAAAAGVTFPRLVFPAFILLPVWAPILLVWVKTQVLRGPSLQH